MDSFLNFQDIPDAGVGIRLAGVAIEDPQDAQDRNVVTVRMFRPAVAEAALCSLYKGASVASSLNLNGI